MTRNTADERQKNMAEQNYISKIANIDISNAKRRLQKHMAREWHKVMTECNDKRIVNDRFRMPSEDDRCE